MCGSSVQHWAVKGPGSVREEDSRDEHAPSPGAGGLPPGGEIQTVKTGDLPFR